MQDKVILITGGSGSFGTAMTERLLKTDVKEIRIYNRNEKAQWLHKNKFNDDRVKYIIGDTKNEWSINSALIGVDYCFHAGAMKHIDMCEANPLMAVENNIYGSINVLKACIRNKVKKLVCLSTDKAVNSESCYGSTKYLMERIMLGNDNQDTEVILTRYGNVLGSNGSVVPKFREQAEKGEPLTITNPDMTRFFMILDEAVELVLFALEQGHNGDMFVYKNKSATVKELADCISDNQIIIGERCPEKTGEGLLSIRELNQSEDLGKYYRVNKNNKSAIHYTEPLTSDNCERFTHQELMDILSKL